MPLGQPFCTLARVPWAVLAVTALALAATGGCDEATPPVFTPPAAVPEVGPGQWQPPPQTTSVPATKACYGVEGAGEPVPDPPEVTEDQDAADASVDAGVEVFDVAADVADDGPDDAIGTDTGDMGDAPCPTCQGAQVPLYAAEDFQPQSCSYRRAYGVDAFRGRPTVAVLLAAW